MSPIAQATVEQGHSANLVKNAKATDKVASVKEEQIVLNTVRCLGADLCQEVGENERLS